jgi:VWFA-related protein
MVLAAALLGYSATVVAQTTTPAPTPRSDQQDKPAPFRVSVDVVAVDVQVIGRDGRPVPDLGPEKFSVTINGRRRRVLTAERIGSDDGEGPGTVPVSAASASLRGRVIVLAVDCVSFDATESRSVIQATREFVKQLSPDDFVGLSAYPNGPKLDPTTNHDSVLSALNQVVGQRDLAERTQFHIRPSELIDVTRELTRGGGPTLDAVIVRECGGTTELPDPFCRSRLITDITNTALYLEGEGTASLGVLRSLVEQMAAFTGRKTLILISGGLLASDSPGGRPDLSEMGIQVGKAAAFANTAIYTLHVDSSFIERFSAQTRAGDKNVSNWNRDSAVMSRWLEQFSGAAGGAMFTVQVGNAEQALNRIRTELSSYYLLGVEPDDEDRDGRTHEITVKTSQPNVTIRGRRWVMVPKRSTSAPPSPSTPAASGPSAPAPAPTPPASTTVRRETPADVQAIVDVFNRGNYDGMAKALAESPNLANIIRGFRMSDSPWPNDAKRSAVFALEMAFAGLRSESTPAREEGARLLAEYHVRVRQPQGADEFECWWFLTEAAALEGMFLPDNALQFIPRALVRCPSAPRLHLAYAFVSEQQWLRGGLTPTQEAEIVARYEAAMKFPDTEPEARVRAARFLHALGQDDRALQVLDGATISAKDKEMPPKDKELQYFAQLTRGQILRARGRGDEAITAFRAALAAWPGAQSARVALMTLLVSRGDREGAATLAEAAQTASDNEFDPWWTYWLGDFRGYPAILDRLRQLAR